MYYAEPWENVRSPNILSEFRQSCLPSNNRSHNSYPIGEENISPNIIGD